MSGLLGWIKERQDQVVMMPEQDKTTASANATSAIYKLFAQVKWRPLPLILGAGLSVLLIWIAFRGVSWQQLSGAMAKLDWRLLGLSLLMSVGGTALRAGRWRLLYAPDQEKVSFFRLTGLLFISQMLNLLIPARVGELARISLMADQPAGRTLGTVAVEKLLDLLTLLAFLLALPLAISLPAWFQTSRRSFLILALSAFSLSLLLFFMKEGLLKWLGALLKVLPTKWERRIKTAFDQALAGLDVFRSAWVGVALMAWSFMVWAWGALVNFVLFRAFGLDLPFSAAVFLLLVLQVGISVPNIPGKLGIFQVMTILALSVFGVGKELALSYSILLYLVGFGPHILLGGLFSILEVDYRR